MHEMNSNDSVLKPLWEEWIGHHAMYMPIGMVDELI